jgi:hypothetical protein
MMELKPLSEALGIQIGSDQVSITTNVSQTFDFADFPAQSTLDGTDLFPFLRGANGNKITWADMMTQFTEIHRSEYFTKTITAQDWGSSSTCAITITQQELQAKNLTAAKVIDQEGIYHSHAHVHPEPGSVYNYANFGVYCSNVTASNNDVVFTFVRNSTIQNTPSMDVTIEVRLG